MIVPARLTFGVAGAEVNPPVTKAWVLSTRLLYASPELFGATLRVKLFVPVQPPASVAVMMTLKVPVAVGVPVTLPLELLMARPAFVSAALADETIVPLPPPWV